MLGLFCAAIATSCERVDNVEVADDVYGTVEGQADSALAVGDSLAMPTMPPAGAGPPVPAASNPPATTHPLSPSLELAQLGAAMVVPVSGVDRSQLRDTYAEARGDRAHEALDIPAARGTPVLSAADGRLLKIFNSQAGGLMVYATDATERFILLYGHLDSYAEGLSEGMPLVRGQVIGYVGTTGNAPVGTPHLHFGILRGDPDVSWWTGVAVNPYTLLVPVELRR